MGLLLAPRVHGEASALHPCSGSDAVAAALGVGAALVDAGRHAAVLVVIAAVALAARAVLVACARVAAVLRRVAAARGVRAALCGRRVNAARFLAITAQLVALVAIRVPGVDAARWNRCALRRRAAPVGWLARAHVLALGVAAAVGGIATLASARALRRVWAQIAERLVRVTTQPVARREAVGARGVEAAGVC